MTHSLTHRFGLHPFLISPQAMCHQLFTLLLYRQQIPCKFAKPLSTPFILPPHFLEGPHFPLPTPPTPSIPWLEHSLTLKPSGVTFYKLLISLHSSSPSQMIVSKVRAKPDLILYHPELIQQILNNY